MLHKRLISACQKRGAKITQSDHNKNEWTAKTKTSKIVWFKQDEDAICVHWPSPHTDTMTDCYCDTWFKTIKAASESLGPKVEKKRKKRKARRKTRKAAKRSKAKPGSSLKELAEAAGLKPGDTISSPNSKNKLETYTIGKRGRAPSWVRGYLIVIAHGESVAAKPKPPPKRKGARKLGSVQTAEVTWTVAGMLKVYEKDHGKEVADPVSGKVYKIGQRGRKPSWLRDALRRALGIKANPPAAAPKRRRGRGKPKVLGNGSYRVDGVFHYVGEDATLEVPAGSQIEKVG